jgi:hypothetical protein
MAHLMQPMVNLIPDDRDDDAKEDGKFYRKVPVQEGDENKVLLPPLDLNDISDFRYHSKIVCEIGARILQKESSEVQNRVLRFKQLQYMAEDLRGKVKYEKTSLKQNNIFGQQGFLHHSKPISQMEFLEKNESERMTCKPDRPVKQGRKLDGEIKSCKKRKCEDKNENSYQRFCPAKIHRCLPTMRLPQGSAESCLHPIKVNVKLQKNKERKVFNLGSERASIMIQASRMKRISFLLRNIEMCQQNLVQEAVDCLKENL